MEGSGNLRALSESLADVALCCIQQGHIEPKETLAWIRTMDPNLANNPLCQRLLPIALQSVRGLDALGTSTDTHIVQ